MKEWGDAKPGEEGKEAQEDTTGVAGHGDTVERVESKISRPDEMMTNQLKK